MSSRLRSRHVVATVATAAAIFLAVVILLAVRMAGGDDPSLGAGTAQPVTSTVTQEQAPAVEQQPCETYEGDAYGDDQERLRRVRAGPAAPGRTGSPDAERHLVEPPDWSPARRGRRRVRGIVADLTGAGSGRASIVLVDDHAVLRRGLRLLLALEEGLPVVAEAADADTALSWSASTSRTSSCWT